MERRVRSRLQLVPWKAVLLTHYFMIFVTWGIGNLSVEKGGDIHEGGRWVEYTNPRWIKRCIWRKCNNLSRLYHILLFFLKIKRSLIPPPFAFLSFIPPPNLLLSCILLSFIPRPSSYSFPDLPSHSFYLFNFWLHPLSYIPTESVNKIVPINSDIDSESTHIITIKYFTNPPF